MSPNSANPESSAGLSDAAALAALENTKLAETEKKTDAADDMQKRAEAARKAMAMQAFAQAMLKRMTRHNTPFDGRKKATKRAKAKASRKANKKRELYIRYGV